MADYIWVKVCYQRRKSEICSKGLDYRALIIRLSNVYYTILFFSIKTEYVDLILVNIYYGWYSDCGHTELIQRQVKNNLLGWRERTNKPIMVSEYGADTIAGLHQVYKQKNIKT